MFQVRVQDSVKNNFSILAYISNGWAILDKCQKFSVNSSELLKIDTKKALGSLKGIEIDATILNFCTESAAKNLRLTLTQFI